MRQACDFEGIEGFGLVIGAVETVSIDLEDWRVYTRGVIFEVFDRVDSLGGSCEDGRGLVSTIVL